MLRNADFDECMDTTPPNKREILWQSWRFVAHGLGIVRILLAVVVLQHACAEDSIPVSRSHLQYVGEALGPSVLISDEWGEWTSSIQPVAMLQPTPFLPQQITSEPGVTSPAAAIAFTANLFAPTSIDRSTLRRRNRAFSVDYVRGDEAFPAASTDAGDLLLKSPAALGISTQRRTPIVNENRVRSSRVGTLAAAGSYWVPARIDLDTSLSKIDSRLIEDILVIPGPYSSLYGPGFQFVDFELRRSPRYGNGPELHGLTSALYKENGQQLNGLQSFWAGDSDWGLRFDYSYRRGSDYRSGDETLTPAGYQSQEFKINFGRDLGGGRSVEFSLLRLDQTDVEFPGFVFDIDSLVTDAYEITYLDDGGEFYDRMETEIWYNRTRFDGNAQDPSKRAQFPILGINELDYVGTTDVDSLSTGYRQGFSWISRNHDANVTVGHDLRFIKQELNEISSGNSRPLPFPFVNQNSPIPRSFSVNPGLFLEYDQTLDPEWSFRSGGRIDFVQTDIIDDPGKLSAVGIAVDPPTYQETVGTSESQEEFLLWSVFATIEHRPTDQLSGSFSLGYAERPPSLTELYAAGPFLSLIQNGLNTVTGDPRLDHERLIQFDVTFDYESDGIKTGVRAFHGWVIDYITFEATSVSSLLNAVEPEQVNLRYVNTDLATLAGFEGFLELFPSSRLTPFATIRFVDGRDRTRNGDFATIEGVPNTSSLQDSTQSRGGLSGPDSESLPSIAPLESRVGLRLNNSRQNGDGQANWNVDLSARIVDNQDRVAASLFESPTPGFTVFDVRGTYQPSQFDGMTLVAGIENFTDKQYREHLDFRSPAGTQVFQPGANFYFGADLLY